MKRREFISAGVLLFVGLGVARKDSIHLSEDEHRIVECARYHIKQHNTKPICIGHGFTGTSLNKQGYCYQYCHFSDTNHTYNMVFNNDRKIDVDWNKINNILGYECYPWKIV